MTRPQCTSVPRRLEPWLSTATKGLCSGALERIRAEVHDHFECVREQLAGEGLPEDEAERRALSALGPARAARRSFRRSYLTVGEAQRLQFLLAPPALHRWALLTLELTWLGTIVLSLSGVGMLFEPSESRLALALLAGSLTLRHGIGPALLRVGALRNAALAGCVGFWLLVVSMVLFSTHLPLAMLVLAIGLVMDGRFLRKLPRHLPRHLPSES